MPKIDDYAVNGVVPRTVYDPANNFFYAEGREVPPEHFAVWNQTEIGKLARWDEDIGEKGIEEVTE